MNYYDYILPRFSHRVLSYHCTMWTSMKHSGKKLHRCYTRTLHNVWNITIRPLTSHLTNHPRKMSEACWLQLEKRRSPMDFDTWTHQQKLTFISSVRTLDAVERTCQQQWLIGMDGENQRNLCCQHVMMIMMMIRG